MALRPKPAIALALPLTYGFDAVRGWLLGTRTLLPLGAEIILLLVFMLVMLGLGWAAFSALERRVMRLGTWDNTSEANVTAPTAAAPSWRGP